jgi:hypothetical protein
MSENWATNGPIVHPPGDLMTAWEATVQYRHGKLQIRPPELSGNITNRVIY